MENIGLFPDWQTPLLLLPYVVHIMEAPAKKAESGADVAEQDLDKVFAKVRADLKSHKN